MAETKVIMPQMGESIFEGTLTKWLKKKGDKVERDEPLFEISTDKVDSEIPSPAAGTLKEILVPEGKTVEINTVVAIIGDGSGATAEAKPAEAKPAEAKPAEAKPAAGEPQPGETEAKKETPKPTEAPKEAAKSQAPAPPPPAEPAESTEDVHSSPLVRKIAKEH